jgi:hypothetical protein
MALCWFSVQCLWSLIYKVVTQSYSPLRILGDGIEIGNNVQDAGQP